MASVHSSANKHSRAAHETTPPRRLGLSKEAIDSIFCETRYWAVCRREGRQRESKDRMFREGRGLQECAGIKEGHAAI